MPKNFLSGKLKKVSGLLKNNFIVTAKILPASKTSISGEILIIRREIAIVLTKVGSSPPNTPLPRSSFVTWPIFTFLQLQVGV